MTTAPPGLAPSAVSPWLPTAPCTPGRCAAHPGPGAPAVGPVRAAARLVAGLAVVLLGVLCAPLTALVPGVARTVLIRLWARAVLRAFGVRLLVRGRPAPADGPLLVVANHVSWLDIPLVAAVLPGRMLAKKEIREWPLLGGLVARGGTLFIDRDGLRALPGTVRRMAGALSGGARVVVFPEGSTWCGRAQGRFRPAAFQAALDAGATVQPVRLAYTPHGPAAFVADDSLAASLRRMARARGLTAELTVLPPIPPSADLDRRTLARAAEHAITGHRREPRAARPTPRTKTPAAATVPASPPVPAPTPAPGGTAVPGRTRVPAQGGVAVASPASASAPAAPTHLTAP